MLACQPMKKSGVHLQMHSHFFIGCARGLPGQSSTSLRLDLPSLPPLPFFLSSSNFISFQIENLVSFASKTDIWRRRLRALRVSQIFKKCNSDRRCPSGIESPPYVNPQDTVLTPFDVTRFYQQQTHSFPTDTYTGYHHDQTSPLDEFLPSLSPSDDSSADSTNSLQCTHSDCDRAFGRKSDLK